MGPGGKGQGAIAINLILSHGKQNIEGLFSTQQYCSTTIEVTEYAPTPISVAVRSQFGSLLTQLPEAVPGH